MMLAINANSLFGTELGM